MRRIAILLGASLALAEPAGAQGFETARIASGLAEPIFLTAPPDDPDRAFVVERAGQIRIIRLPGFDLEATRFLTIAGVDTTGEGGLLGLAFHPDYATNGFFYVCFTIDDDGGTAAFRTRIVRYQVSANPDVANPASATQVLNYLQPEYNNNGGWIGFGPDGLLYIASGDGGGSDDTGTGHTAGTGNAQDITNNRLGKILRIDVDADAFPADPLLNYGIPAGNPFVGVTGDDEIWAYGLRNPWRASFDRQTGDLYIGDVGQGAREEIDVQPAAASGGANYGWRLREGTIATPSGGVGGPLPPGAIDPIYEYPRGSCEFCGESITGGYVYRGPVPALDGRYFFADFEDARLWSLRYDGSSPSTFDGTNYVELTEHTGDPGFVPDAGSIGNVASFGEDGAGNLYILDIVDGEVFYIPEPPSAWMQLVALAMTWALAHRRVRP